VITFFFLKKTILWCYLVYNIVVHTSILTIGNNFLYSGSKIFSTFIGFLKSKDPNDGTEQALLSELTSFDSYLKDNVSGPNVNYVGFAVFAVHICFTVT
jgi:hypothetical protein